PSSRCPSTSSGPSSSTSMRPTSGQSAPGLRRCHSRCSARRVASLDPYGLRRVVRPRGALPQRAEVLDARMALGPDELFIDVEHLNIDAASFRQLSQEQGGDPERIAWRVQQIVAERGKMQNPVTGSGGMLIGRVAEIGPLHPARGELKPGDRIATLVSLTLTPLVLDAVAKV